MNRDENAEWKIQAWQETKIDSKICTVTRRKKKWKPNTKVISGGQKVRQNKQQITVYYSVYGFKRYKSNTQSTHLHSHTHASTEHYTPRIIFVSICRNCCFYMPQFPLLFSVWLLPVFFACRFVCIFVYVGTSVFVCQIKSHHQQTTRGKEDRTAATEAAASISVFRLFLSFVHAWIVANFLAPNCIRRFVRGKSSNAPKNVPQRYGLRAK